MAAGLLQLHTQGGHLLPQLSLLRPALGRSRAVGLRGSVDGLEDTERGQGRGLGSHGPLYRWDTGLDPRALSRVRQREVPLRGLGVRTQYLDPGRFFLKASLPLSLKLCHLPAQGGHLGLQL